MTKYCKELLKFIENFVDEDKTPSDKSESKPVSLSIPVSKLLDIILVIRLFSSSNNNCSFKHIVIQT